MSTHRIYFNARNWEFNKTCVDNIGERCFISGLYGQLEEVFIIGSKTNRRTELVSKPMMLEKNGLYHICFWVKAGEKEESSEVCQLHVIFDGKNDEVYRYRLNGGFINPIKVVEGWRLYDLFFETKSNGVTQLKFVVEKAEVTIMHASDSEDYIGLPDDRDTVNKTSVDKKFTQGVRRNPLDFGPSTVNSTKDKSKSTNQPPHTYLTQNEIEARNLYQQILNKLEDGVIQQKIVDDIVSQLVEQVEKNINLDSLLKELSESVPVEQLQRNIRNVIKEHIKEDSKNKES